MKIPICRPDPKKANVDDRYLWISVCITAIAAVLFFYGCFLGQEGCDILQEVLPVFGCALLCVLVAGVVNIFRSMEYSLRAILKLMQDQSETEKKYS